MQVAIWVVWRSRNELVFNTKQACFAPMIEEIKHLAYLWIKSHSVLKEITWDEWCKFNVSSKCS
ncbi:hypothetical protein HanRHA438_Chr02g0092101 [Helianthus annuus]|nr:hypothetical protein HanRHA438_Chr02g0092101 [Helianthus annuus]